MICNETIRLASINDAQIIAQLARDYVEVGMGWSWTAARTISAIKEKQTNVIVATKSDIITGCGVMEYLATEAHLILFVVHPKFRHQGVGTRMIKWLEATALVNGNDVVFLETRLNNKSARDFYKTVGYQLLQRIPRYYCGRESAITMGHDLWVK